MNIGSTLALGLALSSTAWAVPMNLAQQGRLTDADLVPLAGDVVLEFRLYGDETGGESLWAETHEVMLDEGFYAVTLGEVELLDDDLFAGGQLWLELVVDEVTLDPRQEVVSVPYAFRAATAVNVDGGTVQASELTIGGTSVIDESGSWIGPTPDVDWADLSGIPEDVADGDDDTLGALACGVDELARWNATLSAWECSSERGTTLSEAEVETYVTNDAIDLAAGSSVDGANILTEASADLADGDDDTLAMLVCGDDEIARWSDVEAAWVCGADQDTDTVLSEAEVEDYVTNEAVDLAAGSTVGGSSLATTDDVSAALPSGMITFFLSATCPTGWTEVSEMRGRFLVGLQTDGEPGAQVGASLSDQESRSIDDIPSHDHGVSAISLSSDSSDASHSHSGSSHSHSIPALSGSSGSGGSHLHDLRTSHGVGGGPCLNPSEVGECNATHSYTTTEGDHTHSFSTSGSTTGSSSSSGGSGTATHSHGGSVPEHLTEVAGWGDVDITMPYLQLLACKVP